MSLGKLACNVRTLEELLQNLAYGLGVCAFHRATCPSVMWNSWYSACASLSVYSKRCLLQSVISICPKSLPPTSLSSCATRRISSLSNRSSSRSIGRSPQCSARSVYSASFRAMRNDFCCPCEPYFRNGCPQMPKSMSSRCTPDVVCSLTKSFCRDASSNSMSGTDCSSERYSMLICSRSSASRE